MTVENANKHIRIIERMMFGMFNHKVDGKRIFPTLKVAKEALEKQIPKKPVKRNPICYRRTKDGQEDYAYDYHCVLCDTKINKEKHHCPCGQAIDWSDSE